MVLFKYVKVKHTLFLLFQITWVDGKGNLLREGIEYIVEPLLDQKTFTARSILKLIPKMEHHNTTFTCQAQNLADKTYHSARLRLEVKFVPKVRRYTHFLVNVFRNIIIELGESCVLSTFGRVSFSKHQVFKSQKKGWFM